VQEHHDQKTPQCGRSRLNVWPVVLRELREGARRPVNRRLRFWSAAIALLLLGATIGGSVVPSGSFLLVGLHTFLIVMIFLIVPALTADCIARERRDGTLGLLFLTPLSANGIVAGKLLVQALRAFTLWLAVLPLLTIPFLSGGVTWFDALTAATLEFCTAIICLGAGLLVSSFARERHSAFLLAYILAAVFMVSFVQTFQLILIVSWRGFRAVDWHNLLLSRESISIFLGPIGIRTWGLWSSLATISTLLAKIWKWLCWCSPAIAILILFLINSFAAARIKHSWQDKPPSRLRESLFNRSPRSASRAGSRGNLKFEVPSLVAPLFRRRFRRRMRRYLERNPIAWLQQYSWKARVSKWCLCLVFLAIACMGASGSETTRELMTAALLITLAGFYTFVGVSGFLEEKRSGALELLLVTPITANKLIFGRTWGLWKQFLPAGLVPAGLYANSVWQRYSSDGEWSSIMPSVVAIVLGGFLTLPIFATYFALRVKNLIAAAVLTWIALWMPVIFASVAIDPFAGNRGYWNRSEMLWMPVMVLLCNAAFASLTCFLLRHSLSRRLYSF
jgi:ABC-type Na+ efflux pump permease subunit